MIIIIMTMIMIMIIDCVIFILPDQLSSPRGDADLLVTDTIPKAGRGRRNMFVLITRGPSEINMGR